MRPSDTEVSFGGFLAWKEGLEVEDIVEFLCISSCFMHLLQVLPTDEATASEQDTGLGYGLQYI